MGPHFAQAQKGAQRSAGTNLLTRLRTAAASHQANFTIPPGDYRFSAGGNGYPVLVRIRDMAIPAAGFTFWFDPSHVWGLKFESCTNVQVLGLTLLTMRSPPHKTNGASS